MQSSGFAAAFWWAIKSKINIVISDGLPMTNEEVS